MVSLSRSSLHVTRMSALRTRRGQRAVQPDTRRCDMQGQFAPLPNGATSRGAKCTAELQLAWSKSSASRIAISRHAPSSSGSAQPWTPCICNMLHLKSRSCCFGCFSKEQCTKTSCINSVTENRKNALFLLEILHMKTEIASNLKGLLNVHHPSPTTHVAALLGGRGRGRC